MQRLYNLRNPERIISAVSGGFFFILVGVIFITTPNLLNKIVAFFNDFFSVRVPGTTAFFPAPVHLLAHLDVYTSAGRYCLVWGIFQIFLLALRVVFDSSVSKKSETVGNIVFWLGLSYLIGFYLNSQITLTTWFLFWTVTIILLGMSLIIRAITSAILTR